MANCPTCNGTGWVTYQKPSKSIFVPEFKNGKRTDVYIYDGQKECMIDYASKCPDCNGGEAVIERTKQKAQLPASYYDAEMKDFKWDIYRDDNDKPIDMQKLQLYVESFVNDFKEWQKEGIGLYIWSGTRGSGKTYLASCICNTLIKKYGVKPKFVSAFDLINIEKGASDDKYASRYDKDPIAELCECDVLVIDDLGKQTSDNWTSNIVYRITNERMDKKRITIITSNTKYSNLPFDVKMTDRINKITQPIPLPEYRVRAKEANDQKRHLYERLGLMRKREGDG